MLQDFHDSWLFSCNTPPSLIQNAEIIHRQGTVQTARFAFGKGGGSDVEFHCAKCSGCRSYWFFDVHDNGWVT